MIYARSTGWLRKAHFGDSPTGSFALQKLGLRAQIFAQVKLNAHGRANLDEFAAAIRDFPEVMECYVLMGSVDFMLRIVAADIEAYERFFFEKLSQLPGVQESTPRSRCRR